MSWECWKQSVPCGNCEAEARRREAQRQRDHKLDLQRQANERAYTQKLAELDEEIAHERRLQKEYDDQLYRERILQQRKRDLVNAQLTISKVTVRGSRQSDVNADAKDKVQETENLVEGKPGSPCHDPGIGEEHCDEQKDEQLNISQAKSDWDYQKSFENADNEHLDALMEMIGLESVKQQVLAIKTKIDTCLRQHVSVKDERFGVALLGNPGTGMTEGFASVLAYIINFFKAKPRLLGCMPNFWHQ